MQVEIDQSGKVEWTQKPTVLAIANGMTFTVLISAQAKRLILEELRRRRPERRRRVHTALTFATLLFLLLKEHMSELDDIRIDTEYTGHEALIREHMINLCRRRNIRVSSRSISFVQVGKKSPAHKAAINVFRGKTKPDRVIAAEEVLAEF